MVGMGGKMLRYRVGLKWIHEICFRYYDDEDSELM